MELAHCDSRTAANGRLYTDSYVRIVSIRMVLIHPGEASSSHVLSISILYKRNGRDLPGDLKSGRMNF